MYRCLHLLFNWVLLNFELYARKLLIDPSYTLNEFDEKIHATDSSEKLSVLSTFIYFIDVAFYAHFI